MISNEKVLLEQLLLYNCYYSIFIFTVTIAFELMTFAT